MSDKELIEASENGDVETVKRALKNKNIKVNVKYI